MPQVINLLKSIGVYISSNKDKYEGNWNNDLKNEKGISYYNNGDKYEGEWKNGLKEGKGKEQFN